MKSIFKSVITFLLFFCFVLNISASSDSAEFFGYATPSNPGGIPDSLSRYGGGWPGYANKAFRLTLVDFEGRKIDNTKSVDFSSNAFYKCVVDGVKQKCDFSSYSPINGYYKDGKYVAMYKYKYSDKFKDYNYASNDNQFVLYYDSKGKFTDQYSVNSFLKSNEILSNGWNYGEFKDISFYDMFLHYAGFLDDFTPSFRDLDPNSEDRKKLYNSVVIVEIAYPVYFYSDGNLVYRYGTVTELAQYMIDHPGYGLADGIHSAFRKNIALCISDADKNNIPNFYAIENGVNYTQCSNPNSLLSDIVNDKNGYGINVGIVQSVTNLCVFGSSDCPRPGGTPEPHEEIISNAPEYTFNHCNGAIFKNSNDTLQDLLGSEKADNSATISFNLNSEALSIDELKQDKYKIGNKLSDDNQSLWCVDSVNYSFDDTLIDLGKKFNNFTFVNPRAGKLLISRSCILGSDYNSTNQYNIDSYKNSAIDIKFYDKSYIIYPSDSLSNNSFDIIGKKNLQTTVKPSSFDSSNVLSFKNNESVFEEGGSSFTYVKYDFELYYVIPENLFFVGNVSGKQSGYLKLTNIANSFGYSNELIDEKIFDKSKLGIDTFFEKGVCPFDYEVGGSGTQAKTNINFRIISLNNPFPARDGTSRLPAENWLSTTENNVFNYITNNRGMYNRDPELMYSQMEPMYTITLTPSTMLAIRGYNKKYSYYSMFDLNDYSSSDSLNENDKSADKLKCNIDGRECYSSFIRDNKYIPQDEKTLGGVCFFGIGETDDEKIRQEYNTILALQEYSQTSANDYLKSLSANDSDALGYAENYGADINQNGRIDSEDIEIMITYANAHTYSDEELNNMRQNAYEKGEILNLGDSLYKTYGPRPNAYYVCAGKTYKSGGPVEEEE